MARYWFRLTKVATVGWPNRRLPSFDRTTPSNQWRLDDIKLAARCVRTGAGIAHSPLDLTKIKFDEALKLEA